MAERRWPAGRRRQVLMIAAGVAGTVAAIVVIGRAAHSAELVRRLRGATPGWLVVCAAGELLAYLGFFASYQAMAEVSGGPRIPAPVVVRVVGLSFGAFSVATAIGGLSVDFWALREAGEPASLASARVIALETLRWAVLGVASAVAAIAVLVAGADRPPWPVPVAWLVIVPVCFAGGIWVSAPGRRERLRSGTGGRLRRAFAVAVTALVYLRELRSGPRGLRWRAVFGAVMFWGGELLCIWAALRAFGTKLSPAPLLLGYATGNIATGLPLPAGGSGSVDAALTGGLVLAGASLSGALLGALTFRVFSFWLPALGAVFSVLTVRGLRERLRQIAAQRRLN